MKNLKDFVLENIHSTTLSESSSDSKTFEFDFTDINDGEETVKSLKEYGDYVSGDDNKITVTITPDNIKEDDFDTVQDILQQAIQVARKDTKNASHESYAQKTAKLEATLGKLNNAVDELSDDADNEDKKSEDDK